MVESQARGMWIRARGFNRWDSTASPARGLEDETTHQVQTAAIPYLVVFLAISLLIVMLACSTRSAPLDV